MMEPRNRIIVVRFSEREYDALMEASCRARCFSEWVRDALNRVVKDSLTTDTETPVSKWPS